MDNKICVIGSIGTNCPLLLADLIESITFAYPQPMYKGKQHLKVTLQLNQIIAFQTNAPWKTLKLQCSYQGDNTT